MREPVNDPATVNQMQTRAEITEAVAQIRQLTNDCAALIERTPSAPDPATASNVRGALRQHISEAVDGAADAIEHLSNLMGGGEDSRWGHPDPGHRSPGQGGQSGTDRPWRPGSPG
ncbi:hypothetical protein MBRA_53190 (plasmid) [Mycobacterium branderi]|uniref:Uncharacterized protein n=1 Tax=Mycobacterium branderi TaxID=43348 RepID=A0ABM7KV48_9MYCO|nr:hypothetical protein MBRA_53190 [Mycobacterium branderi]